MTQKILFVISGMASGGAERVMSLLANHSAKDGADTTLALFTYDDESAYALDGRVKIHSLCKDMPDNQLMKNLLRLYRLRKLIRQLQPDVVVSFLTTCNMYTCMAGFSTGVPVVVSERNDPKRICPGKLR